MKTKALKDLIMFNIGIKHKLLASYIIVIIIPVLIGSYLPFVYTQKLVVEETEDSLKFSANQIVESIKYKMLKYNRLSNKLINSGELINFVTGEYSQGHEEAYQAAIDMCNIFRNEIRNNDDEILNIKLYKNNDAIPERGDYILDEKSYRNSGWYRSVYKNNGVSYWKHDTVKRFNTSDIDTVSIISIINAPEPVGLLEIELRQEQIFDSIFKFKYKEDSLIGIIDQAGDTVAVKSDKINGFKAIQAQFKHGTKEAYYDSFIQKVNGEDYLVINQELNYQGWRVVMAVPMKELHRTTNTIRLVTLITSFSCIFVFLFITVFLSDILTSRLKRLSTRMQSVEEGNFNVTMIDKGHDEISQLSRVFNSMVQSIRNLIEEVYKSRIEKKEAELKALHEQINPHFLYNALSSINWLAVQANAPKIIDAVEALAVFYRLSLNKGKESILLKDEITQVKAYLQLQKLRYEDGFEAFFEVDPEVEDSEIIKLILQPFIENAIIHGFGDDETGSIYVTAQKTQDIYVLIRIIDNGKGIEKDKIQEILNKDVDGRKSGGYGIKNVNERIKLHYGDEYGVSICSEPGNGTIVEIKLPLIKRFNGGA